MELKVGVIGTGSIGRDHIRRIGSASSGARVAAVSDINRAAAREIAGKYGAEIFERGEDLIASQGVDAVLVTSTDATHEQYVLASIERGKPVFCEKPLAPKPDGARRIVNAEVAAGKRLVQVGYMRRFDPGYLQLKDAVASGRLGAPLMVHCAHRNRSAGRELHHPHVDRELGRARARRPAVAPGGGLRVRAGDPAEEDPPQPRAAARSPDHPPGNPVGRRHRHRGLRELPVRLRHQVRGVLRRRLDLAARARQSGESARTRPVRWRSSRTGSSVSRPPTTRRSGSGSKPPPPERSSGRARGTGTSLRSPRPAARRRATAALRFPSASRSDPPSTERDGAGPRLSRPPDHGTRHRSTASSSKTIPRPGRSGSGRRPRSGRRRVPAVTSRSKL